VLWLCPVEHGCDVRDRRDQLLWTLLWMRLCEPESACVTHFSPATSEKTYSRGVRKFLHFIVGLNLVRRCLPRRACSYTTVFSCCGTLNPSIIPASQFAPVFVEEEDDHLKCYGHGSAETRHTSINEEFVYRASLQKMSKS
jgi:hypothetical protein